QAAAEPDWLAGIVSRGGRAGPERIRLFGFQGLEEDLELQRRPGILVPAQDLLHPPEAAPGRAALRKAPRRLQQARRVERARGVLDQVRIHTGEMVRAYLFRSPGRASPEHPRAQPGRYRSPRAGRQ